MTKGKNTYNFNETILSHSLVKHKTVPGQANNNPTASKKYQRTYGMQWGGDTRTYDVAIDEEQRLPLPPGWISTLNAATRQRVYRSKQNDNSSVPLHKTTKHETHNAHDTFMFVHVWIFVVCSRPRDAEGLERTSIPGRSFDSSREAGTALWLGCAGRQGLDCL